MKDTGNIKGNIKGTVNTESLIQLKQVHKEYELGETKLLALRGVDLNIPKSKFVSIIGPSGCGKTTTLNMIGCIDRPTKGTVTIEGKDVLSMGDNELTEFRGNAIGFIFQNFNLIPVLNVEENIAYPLLLNENNKISKKEIKERTKFIMNHIGLTDWAKHNPNELSGGQRQRVAIGRALVIHPKIVIADEPTANLDSATSYKIMDLMSTLQKELETTFVFATHDFRFVEYVDTIYEMEDGIIKGEVDKKTLLQHK